MDDGEHSNRPSSIVHRPSSIVHRPSSIVRTEAFVKKIKVLFLYPNQFLGPEMTVYTQIIRHLDRTRFEAYLALDSDAEGDIHLNDKDGVAIVRRKFGSALRGGIIPALVSGLRLPVSMFSLVRFVRREGIDIIQCSSTPRTATLGMVLARMTGARLLLHYHVIPGRYSGPRGFLEGFIARRADRAIAVSKFLAAKVARMGGIPASKVDVVVNGTDCRRFNPGIDGSAIRKEYGIVPDEVLVLQLARIIQQKRQEDVVRAFAIARRQAPKLRGLLVGWEDPRYSGPFSSYKAELGHICAQEGLGDSLIIADARPEAPELVAAADMVVMPSIEDAWNLAVTEAMSEGKPVIGSQSGGIPEQIVDGVTGFLVPEKSPEALAEKMVKLANDANLRATMGGAARHRAETSFDETHLAAEFAPIYELLVKGREVAMKRGRGFGKEFE